MQAVQKMVAGTAHPYPYILYGPPGTGKTKTLVEAICQIAKTIPSSYILVCAPSNAAVDELALRINRNFHNTCPFDHQVLRIYSRNFRNMRKVDRELVSFSNYCLGSCPDNISRYKIIVATLVGGGSLHFKMNYGREIPNFTHIFVDECGSATESATLIPLAGKFEQTHRSGQVCTHLFFQVHTGQVV